MECKIYSATSTSQVLSTTYTRFGNNVSRSKNCGEGGATCLSVAEQARVGKCRTPRSKNSCVEKSSRSVDCRTRCHTPPACRESETVGRGLIPTRRDHSSTVTYLDPFDSRSLSPPLVSPSCVLLKRLPHIKGLAGRLPTK